MARLLIANHTRGKAGGLYLLDTESGAVTPLHQGSRVNGLTRAPDGYYFVTPLGAIYHMEPGTWKVTLRAETGFTACHDLRYIGDHFYVVASDGNRVVRFNRELQQLDELRVVDSDDDVCHANCIQEVDGELLLSIFTLYPGPRQEKNETEHWRREGKLLRLDWEKKSYEIVMEPLSQPHSIFPREGRLYCCESLTSEVVLVSLKDRTKKRLCKLWSFVRGIEFLGDSVFIGISRRRKPGPLLERLLAPFRIACGVVELDAKTWRPRRTFAIPGSQVYELMLVEE